MDNKRFAIVRFLDEKHIKWGVFWPSYLAHEKTLRADTTIRCSEIPSLKTFGAFLVHIKKPDCDLSEFSPSLANDYLVYLSGRFKQNTVRHKLAVIREAFTWAIVSGLLSGENPFQSVEPPQSVHGGRDMTDKQLRTFIDALPLTYRRACVLSLYSGLRRSELVKLDWAHVHQDYIEVIAAHAKSKKARLVPLHPRARRALGPRPRAGGLVFPISISSFNHVVTRTWKRLGIGRIRIHDMRHVFASRYMERTRDLFGLMAAAGWASPRSAFPYQHLSISRQRGNIMKLGYRF